MRDSAKPPTSSSSTRRCVSAATTARRRAPKHTAASRGWIVQAGNSFAQIHVPIACRHCEQPHCMKDCPPNAIHRSSNGRSVHRRHLHRLRQLSGRTARTASSTWPTSRRRSPACCNGCCSVAAAGPGEIPDYEPREAAKARGKKAVKCDACVDVAGGPACVKRVPDRRGAADRPGPFRRSRGGPPLVIHENILQYRNARYLWWSIGSADREHRDLRVARRRRTTQRRHVAGLRPRYGRRAVDRVAHAAWCSQTPLSVAARQRTGLDVRARLSRHRAVAVATLHCARSSDGTYTRSRTR